MKIFASLAMMTCFIIVMGIASAQVTFGPVIGINFSGTTPGIGYINYDRDYGFKMGGMADIPLQKNVFLHTGILYNTKRYLYSFWGYNSHLSYVYGHYLFSYLEIPLTLKMKCRNGMHVDGGTFAGYQVSQYWDETLRYSDILDDISQYKEKFYENHDITGRRFQAGVIMAAGYVKSGFDLTLTSQYHLTSLFREVSPGDKKQHLLALSLSLAYHFQAAGKGNGKPPLAE